MSVRVAVRWIIVALVAALTFAGPPPPAAADRAPAAELDKRIVTAAHQLEVVVEQYNQSRDDLTSIQAQAGTLGARLAPLAHDVETRKQLIGALAANTYQRTRSGPTVALFGSATPHEFVDRLLVLDQLAGEQQRAVAEMVRAREQLDGARRTLRALAARERQEQLQLAVQKATVEAEINTLRQMRQIAYGGGSRFAADYAFVAPPYVPGRAGRVAAFAFGQLGKPYRWGSAGPHSYDCSGLTLAAWSAAGVHLPHNAARQYGSVAHVRRSDLRPGDLIFYYGRISHVGVYIGRGMMIHAPEYGENVRIAPIDSQPIHGFGRPR